MLPHVIERFQLYFAPEVGRELSQRFASGREFWGLVRRGELTEVPAHSSQVKEFGPGERAAMNLALDHRDWTLLMDDRRPLQEALRLGLRTVCTPVLVVALYDDRHLDLQEALAFLAGLQALQTVSPALIEAAIAQLGIAATGKEKSDDNC